MNDEKARTVLCLFSAVAKQYDFMNTLLSIGIHHLWKRTAVRMLGLTVGDRVLDICGGTGDLSILSQRYVGLSGQVVLYDINMPMMEAGRSRKDNVTLRKQISYVQGDAEQLSFSDNCFDAAIVGFGIRNLTNTKKGFMEMYRILKPGGKMMCLEFSQPSFAPFRWIYDAYSFHIMPRVGKLFTGSRKAYAYLPESIRLFYKPNEVSAILEKIGFTNVIHRKLTNGIAIIHLGIK